MKFSLQSLFNSSVNSRSLSRRNILKILGNLFGFLCVAFLSWSIWRFITFHICRTKDVLFQSKPREGEVSLINGVYLISNHGRLIAFSAKCTHLGCTINYSAEKKLFCCPCHGSIFDIKGNRVSGPASHSLEKFAYEVKKNGSVLVKKSL